MLFCFPAGSCCCRSPRPVSGLQLWGSWRAWGGKRQWVELLVEGLDQGEGKVVTRGLLKRGEQFNVINILTVYQEWAVCTHQSTGGHYTGLCPVLSNLVTDAVEATDTWSQLLSNPKRVRLFAHIHRSYTNLLWMETTEDVQTVRILSDFFKKAFSVVSTFKSVARFSWSQTY